MVEKFGEKIPEEYDRFEKKDGLWLPKDHVRSSEKVKGGRESILEKEEIENSEEREEKRERIWENELRRFDEDKIGYLLLYPTKERNKIEEEVFRKYSKAKPKIEDIKKLLEEYPSYNFSKRRVVRPDEPEYKGEHKYSINFRVRGYDKIYKIDAQVGELPRSVFKGGLVGLNMVKIEIANIDKDLILTAFCQEGRGRFLGIERKDQQEWWPGVRYRVKSSKGEEKAVIDQRLYNFIEQTIKLAQTCKTGIMLKQAEYLLPRQLEERGLSEQKKKEFEGRMILNESLYFYPLVGKNASNKEIRERIIGMYIKGKELFGDQCFDIDRSDSVESQTMGRLGLSKLNFDDEQKEILGI